MRMSPQEFWGSNYYNHPPLNPEILNLFEERFEVKLPALYVELLQFQNGGYTNGYAFPMITRTSWADDHVPLEALSGIVIDPSIKSALNLMDGDYLSSEWGLPPKQILLNGDGHWWITLDYRSDEKPNVLWIDTEEEEIVPIAPSFEVFFDGLRPSSEFTVE